MIPASLNAATWHVLPHVLKLCQMLFKFFGMPTRHCHQPTAHWFSLIDHGSIGHRGQLTKKVDIRPTGVGEMVAFEVSFPADAAPLGGPVQY
jgi:hypothetical protein